MLADLEVVRLDALLGGGDGPGYQLVFDRLAFFHAEPLHDLLDALRAEDPQQVVLQRKVEARRARVALTARAPAELVVDTPRLVTFGADDVETAQRHDLFVLGLRDLARLRQRRPARLGGRGDGIEPALAQDLLR